MQTVVVLNFNPSLFEPFLASLFSFLGPLSITLFPSERKHLSITSTNLALPHPELTPIIGELTTTSICNSSYRNAISTPLEVEVPTAIFIFFWLACVAYQIHMNIPFAIPVHHPGKNAPVHAAQHRNPGMPNHYCPGTTHLFIFLTRKLLRIFNHLAKNLNLMTFIYKYNALKQKSLSLSSTILSLIYNPWIQLSNPLFQ